MLKLASDICLKKKKNQRNIQTNIHGSQIYLEVGCKEISGLSKKLKRKICHLWLDLMSKLLLARIKR